MFGSSTCPPAFASEFSKTMAKKCEGKGGLCYRTPASIWAKFCRRCFILNASVAGRKGGGVKGNKGGGNKGAHGVTGNRGNKSKGPKKKAAGKRSGLKRVTKDLLLISWEHFLGVENGLLGDLLGPFSAPVSEMVKNDARETSWEHFWCLDSKWSKIGSWGTSWSHFPRQSQKWSETVPRRPPGGIFSVWAKRGRKWIPGGPPGAIFRASLRNGQKRCQGELLGAFLVPGESK